MKPTIAFTGGHHNSALVVAKELKKMGYPLIWFGHKFTASGDKSLSAEYHEVTNSNIKFLELKTGKFYKKFGTFEWLKIIFGFLQATLYLLKYRPSLIFSSGGYLSVPIVIMGWVFRIPSITHEQTVIAGMANKAIAPFVKKILLTHESSSINYPKGKSVVVGLPIRQQLLSGKYTKSFTPPLLYITCGKQGSHIINQVVFPIIPQLIKRYTIIHQTGANTVYKDLEKARRLKEKLGDLSDRYVYAPYFFSDEAATYLRSAKIIISRSGAHNSYELMVLGKKAVLIPIPWVSHNEQLLNAKLVAQNTGSLILEEKDLTSESLLNAIIELGKSPKVISSVKLPTDATKKIISIIHQYV